MDYQLLQTCLAILPTANAYFEEMKAFGFSLDQIDLASKNGRRNFEKLQLQILKSRLQQPSVNSFKAIDFDTNLKAAINFFQSFLGKESSAPLETLPITRNTNLGKFDGVTEATYDLKNRTIKPTRIMLFRTNISYSSLMLCHENTRILFNQKVPTPGFHYHYNEILPTLVELIAASTLKLQDENLFESYQCVRLWALKEHFEEYIHGILVKKMPRKPQITTLPLEYSINNSYSYIISIIFAFHLFEQYQSSPEEITEHIKACLTHKETVEELLKNTNVSLQNEDTIKATQKILKMYQK